MAVLLFRFVFVFFRFVCLARMRRTLELRARTALISALRYYRGCTIMHLHTKSGWYTRLLSVNRRLSGNSLWLLCMKETTPMEVLPEMTSDGLARWCTGIPTSNMVGWALGDAQCTGYRAQHCETSRPGACADSRTIRRYGDFSDRVPEGWWVYPSPGVDVDWGTSAPGGLHG